MVLLDFGLARQAVRSNRLTRTGVIVGTPEYMAPEQARGEQDVGLPADIFSLGCVLFECLTGRPPFIGEHLTAVLVKVLIEEAPLVHTLRPDVPLKLSELVARMLQKAPKNRFASGVELNEAVRRIDLADERKNPPSPSRPTRMTPHEQLFLGVAIAVHPASGRDGTGDPLVALRGDLRELGVNIERLSDDSLVATALPSASAADQALLAARCGLLMKRRLPMADVAVASGLGQMRGPRPIGEVVDRALHLLATDDVGVSRSGTGVWLDLRTHELLSGRLDVALQSGRIQLIGEREDERRLLGQPAPFVGREQELGTLQATLGTCIDDSVAQAIGVIASPGLGMSRLRHEFLRAARLSHPSLVVLLGRGDLMQGGAPYAILGGALRSLCGLAGGESAARQQQCLSERLGRHLGGGPEVLAHTIDFLGELCGVRFSGEGNRALQTARGNPKVMHEQLTHAFLAWLRSECQAAPVLLVLDDLHWGDPLSVQLLAHALRDLAELPLLVLLLARPEVNALFPSFWNARHLHEIPLRPLSRRAAERLADEVLAKALGSPPDPRTVARIVEQGAGHPLLLEELLRAAAVGRGDALPETVLAMLLARLSQLDTGARQTLRAASVYGERFTRAGVAALAVGEAAADLDISLAALQRSECIERQREAGVEGEHFKFRHTLVRDAAYSQLTAENQVVAHRLAGAYLERCHAVEPALLAEHAERGLEPERAALWGLAAARKAFAAYDPELAQRHARRALAGPVSDEQRGILRTIEAWSCHVRMDLAGAYERALEALDLLRAGSYWWTKAIGICFLWSFAAGRFERFERMNGAFMAATPEPDARVAFLEAGSALSVSFTNIGQRRAAADTVAKMREVASSLDPQDHGFLLLADSYRLLKLEPDLSGAIGKARLALGLVASDGEGYIHRAALFYLGVARAAAGAVAEGEQLLRDGIAVAMRLREDFGAVIVHLHLGLILAAQPDPAKQAEARHISTIYLDRGEIGPAMVGLCHHIVGQIRLLAGDLAGAEEALNTAISVFGSLLPSRLLVVPFLVEVFLRQGRVADARTVAEEALLHIEEQGGLGHCELPLRLAVSLARLAAGHEAAARDTIDAAKAEVHRRAGLMEDPEDRSRFLQISVNRRILALGNGDS